MRIKTLLQWNSQRVAVVALLAIGLLLPVLAGLASSSNAGPSANAGPPQFVAVGATVRLDGSRSTSSTGAPLAYLWSFVSWPAASAAALTNPTAVNPTFSADQAGTYILQLAISDGITVSTSQVVISTQATPPVADAGPNQVVAAGAMVHLDGSGSCDADGDRLSFQWSLVSIPAGSQTSISDPAAVAPTFVADVAGTYVAQLSVSDTHGNNSSASVTISTQDLPPIANAGDTQLVAAGTTVQLGGSGSFDPGGDPLTYSWSILTQPSTSAASLSSATIVNPTFVADVAGAYVVQLAVTDSHGNMSLATVEVATDSIPPVANAGAAQTVAPGSTVQLDGTKSSDAGGAPLNFSWALIAKPAGSSASLLNTFSSTSSFIADKAGQYLAQVVVSNGVNTSSPSTVLVTAATAGANLVVSPSTLNFGNQAVGTTSNPMGVTITNIGSTSVQVTSFLMSGLNAREFRLLAAGFPLTVAPNGAVILSVQFTPLADGPRSANLAFYDSSGGAPHGIALIGSGGTGAPVIQLSPLSVPFADQLVGTSSAPQSLTVTNTGNAALQITGLAIGGTNSGDFGLPLSFILPTPAAPINVAANGGTTTIPLLFKPTTTGSRSATLLITDNASGSPHSAGLSGNGTAGLPSPISVTPASILFSDQPVGNSSTASPVTVTNNTANAVQITALTFSGANAADFTTTATPPVPVAANGGTAVIPVTFKPSASGPRSATLTITDNSGGSAHSVTLSGNGTIPPPGISVSPASLDFQNQTVSVASSPLQVTITNTGGSTVNVTGLLMMGFNGSDFTTTSARSFAIATGANVKINLVFTPQALGQRSATLVITDDTGGQGHSVQLSGTGVTAAPAIAMNPTSLSFPNQPVGTSSAPLQVTVTNNGTAPLQISALSFNGSNAGDYSLTQAFQMGVTYPITVAANGGTTNIPVVFKPAAMGNRTAALVITDNADFSPHSVSLSGTGTAATVVLNPTSVDFLNQNVGTTSNATSITVTNTGNAALQITGSSFGGSNPGDFIFPASFTPPTPASPITVAANGGTTSVPIMFKPTATRSRSATLVLTDNAGDSPQSVALSGNGIGATVVLNPASLTFGTQLQNVASAPMPFSITNTGNADLQITAMSFGGPNATEFSFPSGFNPPTPATPMIVPANGGVANLSAIFTPSAMGPRSASLSISDNAIGSPQALPVSGTGIAPVASLTASSITFPNQGINTTSIPMAVTVTNTGTAPLHITGFSIVGANAAEFATTAVPGTVAANGGSMIVPATFTPTALGTRTATLQIADDAANSPQTVSLSGNGVTAPIFNINPTSLTFPAQQGNQQSSPLLLTISNTGTADLVVNGITKTGANPGDFSFAILGGGSFPQTVSPNGTLGINVFFTPADGGQRSATLVFSDNANGSPHQVPVSGTGIATPPSVTLNPTSLTFPEQPVNTTSLPLTVTITNSGQTNLTVTSVSFSGANASEFGVTPSGNFIVTKNGGTATLSVTFTPAGLNTRTATMSIADNAPNTPQTLAVTGTGRGQGQISLSALSLGRNLEALATGSLDVAPSSPLTVTITSSDPSKVLLVATATDPSGATQGSAQITGTVPAGQGKFGFGFPGFWVQGLASSGTAQITISAPGYASGSATVTLTPSGFVLNGPAGPGVNFNAVMGTNSSLTVSPVRLDNAGNILSTSQVLRGGITASVNVNSGTTSVGTIGNSPVVVQAGSATSSAALFQALSVGSSVVSITQPSGYTTPASETQLTVNVTAPVVSLTSASLGFNQQSPGTGQLTPSSSGISVTITSSDPTKVLLSSSPTSVGSSSIVLSVPANTSILPAFYLQGLGSSGTVVLTATAPGYTSGTANVALTPSAFILNGPNGTANFTTTTLSGATNLSLTLWQLDSGSRPFSAGQMRPGRSDSVTVLSGTPSTGAIFGSPAAFNGGDVSNTNLAFDPAQNCNTPCTSTLSVVQPAGYGTPASGGQITVTVTAPAVTVRMTESTIGGNLEVQATGALDGPSPTDLPVTITSDNPNVWLSTSATLAGSQSITVTVPAGSGVNSFGFPAYYVQALATSGTAHLTASAPGYSSTTSTVTLAPSAFVIAGPNGVGANFGTFLSNGSVSLTVMAVVLDSSLSPSQISQQVRGGLAPSVTVTSDSAAAVIADSPLSVNPGSTGGMVTLQLQSKGQANISVTTPPGFTTPSSGNHLSVQIN